MVPGIKDRKEVVKVSRLLGRKKGSFSKRKVLNFSFWRFPQKNEYYQKEVK